MNRKATRRYIPMTKDRPASQNITNGRISGLKASFIFLIIVCSFLGIPSAHASPSDERVSFEQAKQCLEGGDFATAYQAFYELFKEDPANPEINFLLGRAAFGNKDYEAAIMAFERVLIVRPDADRVKLEMGRCLYNLGSIETARQYFEEVLAKDPPENVRVNIQRYLNAIKSTGKQHFLSGRITLGVDFDDNANVAPANPEIDITTALGDVIPISVDAAEKDRIYSSTINLNYLYKPMHSPLAWKISCVNYNAFYQDVENLDVELFDLKAGMSLQGKRIIWELYGITNHLNLDYDQYQRSYGGGTGISLALRPNLLLSLDGKFRKKNYFDTNERDADNISASFAPAFSFGLNRLTATLGWEYENAAEDVNTFTRLSAILTYDRQLPYGFTFSATYWYQKTDYDEADTLFNIKRSDDVQYCITGLSKRIWQSSTQGTALLVNAGYTYTRSDSTIDLYEYTKNVISTSVSFVF
jgi:tetratricopeptide (TPR) repeat protein